MCICSLPNTRVGIFHNQHMWLPHRDSFINFLINKYLLETCRMPGTKRGTVNKKDTLPTLTL